MSKLLIAVFDGHKEAAESIKALLESGIDRQAIAALGKGEESPEKEFELQKENEHIKWWAETGTVWGGIFGLLAGAFLSVVPGFGPIVAAGHIVPAIAGALGGAMTVGPAAALGAWMADFALEEAEKIRYHKYLEAGKILLIVRCDEPCAEKARSLLDARGVVTHLH